MKTKLISILILCLAILSCDEEQTSEPTDICSGLIPNQTNVMQALVGFTYDGTCLTNKSEAQNMLRYICPDVSIHYPDENTVCGEFEGGYHLTLWIGTYGETNKYGLRYGKEDDHSFWGDNSTYFEITKTCFNFCNVDIPNGSNVLEALENYTFDGTSIANHTEAENILKHLCSSVSIHYPDENTVCGEFGTGYHLTLWVNTYSNTDRYGARYGTDDNHSFWGSNDTYFEIIKP